MKKRKMIESAVILAIGTVCIFDVAVGEEAKYSSDGVVKFKSSSIPTNPLDPLDPTKPIKPIDPTSPNTTGPEGTPGPLSIDFVSNFSFGEQEISSEDKFYYADPQKFLKQDNTEAEGPNFVQVTDNRGSEGGWTLSVRQNGQFQSSSGKMLKGAQLSLLNGNIVTAAQDNFPSYYLEQVTLTPYGTQINMMTAKKGEGAGTYLLTWGTNEKDGATSIQLDVPGGTTKTVEKYATNMTWSLQDIPSN